MQRESDEAAGRWVEWHESNDKRLHFIGMLTKRKSAHILSTSFFMQVDLETR
jgi:uncharacterized pyridoxal phosphate-containing UPF0001 family protein